MSKALLAFVWIASPLAGTLVQPYIGIRSDNCRISWGKRKPFMFAGAAGTIVALLALAWVQEIVGGLLGLFGADPNSGGVRTTIIIVATALMCCLDFAVNTGTHFLSWEKLALSMLMCIQYKPVSVALSLIMHQPTSRNPQMHGPVE